MAGIPLPHTMTDNTDTPHDPRTDEMKREMAEYFGAFEYEYREDPHTKCEVVFENEDVIIVADRSGHELNEWASDFGVGRGELSEWMHYHARQYRTYGDVSSGAGDPWAVYDPVVFEKLNDTDD